ncbi:FkbM family methyltransferase [Rhodocyclus tenuis]|uniref:FkbM family methyltransferase n=3 Tax=Rhodocyclus gracilis TaxID=2929842 RepID=A0ABX0WI37_9RHOO|nr:FkbM family methyltransferase [Rhodocyclus gracilis]NJA88516.1 FkbM family methyltransferase [Rhodocyclus gracilis]
MANTQRPIPFILISSNHGTMIINRHDYQMVDQKNGYGVGYQLLNTSSCEPQEIDFALALLKKRRAAFGDGVMAIDCGANVGVHTIEWARLMYGWGEVISFEAQERIYYALAGNVAINNCLNVSARFSAVGAICSQIEIPEPNYLVPSSFGSFELRKSEKTEYIGQYIDYKKTRTVPLVSIDSLGLKRLDFIKIDVEGMEEEVLDGAKKSIEKYRPIVMIEVIKSDRTNIENYFVSRGYKVFQMGMNDLAIHQDDPTLASVSIENGVLWLR